MTDYQLENLTIKYISDDILLAHQIKASAMFTRCDGLIILPRKGRNTQIIVLDLNLEPKYVKAIYDEFGPVSDYVCTHTHLDHSSHVHVWEELGARIYAPLPEYKNLLNGKNFLENFGFLDGVNISIGESFVNSMGYKPCNMVNTFSLGVNLKFEDFIVETIPFLGHSKGHIGFFLPSEKILHISCLGFDQPAPGVDGFGPWYGFYQCSIPQYLKDIDHAESIFLKRASILTSSHSYVVKNPDITPFSYMREKIENNQSIVDQAITSLKSSGDNKIAINDLLKLDLFFPKKKIKGFLKEIYSLWEYWIINKHIERSKYLK